MLMKLLCQAATILAALQLGLETAICGAEQHQFVLVWERCWFSSRTERVFIRFHVVVWFLLLAWRYNFHSRKYEEKFAAARSTVRNHNKYHLARCVQGHERRCLKQCGSRIPVCQSSKNRNISICCFNLCCNDFWSWSSLQLLTFPVRSFNDAG